jgi:hypothetical protein
MYKYILSILLIITSIIFSGCLTPKDATPEKVTVDIFNKEYYNSASNNLERLQRLLSGVFVFYHDDVDKKTVKWVVNENQDSIMAYTMPVGNVNKIGYWVYNVQFMTSIPNKPIYSNFTHLIQKSRDTILAVSYLPKEHVTPAEAFQKGKDAFLDVEFKKLEKSEEVLFVKKNNTLFNGQSNLHPYKHKRKDIKESEFKIDYYNVGMKKTILYSIYYPEEEKVDSLGRLGVNQYICKIDIKKSPIVKFLNEMDFE